MTSSKKRVLSAEQRQTLDELLELGRDTVAGHELDPATRHLYRID